MEAALKAEEEMRNPFKGVWDRWLVVQDSVNAAREEKMDEMKKTCREPYTGIQLAIDEAAMAMGFVLVGVFITSGKVFWGIVLLAIGVGSYGRILERCSSGRWLPFYKILWRKYAKRKRA